MTGRSPLLLTVTLLSAWGTFAPAVWLWCDRACTRARLSSSSVPAGTHLRGDIASYLDAVARAVRAGESPVRALTAAAACSRPVARVQADLRSGATLRDVLDRGAPEIVLLRSCLHQGVLSADALENAARAERLARRARADAAAAVATASPPLICRAVMPSCGPWAFKGTVQASPINSGR